MAKKYNEVTPEILEQFKAIVPGKVYAGEEINSDYFHDGHGAHIISCASIFDGAHAACVRGNIERARRRS